MKNWPKNSSRPLLVPLGVGENRKLVYRGLANMPHALVGGATGAGKTTLLHAWTCSLLMHNKPDRLHLAFIDLKGGAEAQFYENVPHLLPDGIIFEKELVVPMLEHLHGIVEDRLAQFRKGHVQNIAAWNYQHRSNPLPRVVLIVDELANIMLDKSLKSDAESLLADLSARGRAPGVHIVLATQRPEVKVVTGLIKANMDGRLAFRMTDQASSRTILDTTEAARFDDSTPLGRFIYKRGLDRYEIQAPLITSGQIKRIVSKVKAGESADSANEQMSPEEVFRFALQNLDGSLARRPLYKALGGKVSHSYIQELSSYDGEVFDLDGQTYVVKPPNGGRKPRRIELIEAV
jgi:S-DNA-T family DNA segregation ATPase FtsK/SpoIIIE